MTYPPPQQPYQPVPGPPGGPAYGAPPGGPLPPKQSNTGKIIGFSCLGAALVGVLFVGGCTALVANTDTGSSDTVATEPRDTPAADDAGDKEAEKKPDAKPKSQAEQFKAFVAKNGSTAEKDAVKHVTKIQGADKQNDIMDAADVYTDYTGGMMGPHSGDAKLIASAFADWKTSENGLVSVYDKDGELISNGNF